MKKGFTFAELMISLLVISVLSAILYPTIAQFTPNTNKPLFKSAYRTLTSVLSEIVNESTTGDISTENLCVAFCDKANIIAASETDTCATLCANNTLTTNNGMRWYFSAYDANNDTFTIYVDVNASNNKLQSTVHANLDITEPWNTAHDYMGVFYYDDTNDSKIGIYDKLPNANDATNKAEGDFNADNLKAQDTFKFTIDKKGKITYISPAGWAHLSDSTQSPD